MRVKYPQITQITQIFFGGMGYAGPVTLGMSFRAHPVSAPKGAPQNRPRARKVGLGWRSVVVMRQVRIAPRDRLPTVPKKNLRNLRNLRIFSSR